MLSPRKFKVTVASEPGAWWGQPRSQDLRLEHGGPPGTAPPNFLPVIIGHELGRQGCTPHSGARRAAPGFHVPVIPRPTVSLKGTNTQAPSLLPPQGGEQRKAPSQLPSALQGTKEVNQAGVWAGHASTPPHLRVGVQEESWAFQRQMRIMRPSRGREGK